MGGGYDGVEVHHGDEAKNQERWQEPNDSSPLPGAPHVEVVLRHFDRTSYGSSPLWFFCLERALVSWLLARDGHGECSGLRGLGRRSVTPYMSTGEESCIAQA
jgi:hypothetical protein